MIPLKKCNNVGMIPLKKCNVSLVGSEMLEIPMTHSSAPSIGNYHDLLTSHKYLIVILTFILE